MEPMQVDEPHQTTPKAQHEASHPVPGRNGPRRAQLTPAEADSYLAQRFSAEVSAHLKEFCSIKVPESELNSLNAHPEMIVRCSTFLAMNQNNFLPPSVVRIYLWRQFFQMSDML
jgi:hypothetical protein